MDTGRDVHTMWVTSLEMVILYCGFKKSVWADLLASSPDFTLGALSSALKLPSRLAFSTWITTLEQLIILHLSCRLLLLVFILFC